MTRMGPRTGAEMESYCTVCKIEIPYAEWMRHRSTPEHERNLHPVRQADYDKEDDDE